MWCSTVCVCVCVRQGVCLTGLTITKINLNKPKWQFASDIARTNPDDFKDDGSAEAAAAAAAFNYGL